MWAFCIVHVKEMYLHINVDEWLFFIQLWRYTIYTAEMLFIGINITLIIYHLFISNVHITTRAAAYVSHPQ